jgi:CDP-diacylglycerol--glycerol-3-phosphate 3-phosphatidyltransferase
VPVDGDALRDWSHRHDGYDARSSLLVRGWLTAMHTMAAPLARRGMSPDVLTAAGVAAAAAAVVTPRPMAGVCVIGTGVLDGLDGAVALARGRADPRGQRIDHAADRITDVLFAAALWRAGVPVGLSVAVAATTLGYELSRSSLRRSTLRDVALVTMGERPIRVAVVAAGLVVAPTAGAATVVALLAGAALQVRRAVRRSR